MRETFKRLISSIQPLYFLTVLGLIITIIVSNSPKPEEIASGLNKLPSAQLSYRTIFFSTEAILLEVLTVAFIILIISTVSEYQRKTHDWTLIFKYQDWFNELHAKKGDANSVRNNAAQYLLSNNDKGKTALWDILDLFEDMGFYLKGNQLSSKIIHHYFYHWIRIYCQKAEKHIADYRSEEPARYEHLPRLLEAISNIEAKKQKVPIDKLKLSDEKLKQYLEEELDEALYKIEKTI